MNWTSCWFQWNDGSWHNASYCMIENGIVVDYVTAAGVDSIVYFETWTKAKAAGFATS